MAGKYLEIKGAFLIAVIGALVWLSIAIYQKEFVDSIDITVETERAGLQLNENADVRMRGALVGRVTGIDQRDGMAVIEIALDPDEAEEIPADVSARIIPTTLFGQKYVELVAPRDGTNEAISAGAVIDQDRSSAAVEITTALDHLEPVLRAVRPQDISSTLQAVATGLEGRGDQLGETVVETRRLLGRLHRYLPLLADDLDLLADVTQTYADAAPDLLAVLDNVSVTADTVIEQKAVLATFYAEVTGLSDTLRVFLDANGDGLVEANRVTRPLLSLLASYAGELPCVLRGFVASDETFGSAFAGGKLKSFATLGLQYPAYDAADVPDFSAPSRGPSCLGLPDFSGPLTIPNFADGGDYPEGALIVP